MRIAHDRATESIQQALKDGVPVSTIIAESEDALDRMAPKSAIYYAAHHAILPQLKEGHVRNPLIVRSRNLQTDLKLVKDTANKKIKEPKHPYIEAMEAEASRLENAVKNNANEATYQASQSKPAKVWPSNSPMPVQTAIERISREEFLRTRYYANFHKGYYGQAYFNAAWETEQ